MRRNKLSNLLKREYEQYHRELLSNQDTPEHQRQMMEEKLIIEIYLKISRLQNPN